MAGSGKAHLRDREDVLIRAEDLVVEFPVSKDRVVNAVSGISLDVKSCLLYTSPSPRDS